MTEVVENNTPVTEKLWAGKYKTPEEMEEAIQGKDKEYVKLKQTHDALQNAQKAPDDYAVPDNADLLQSEVEALKAAAKTANLNQEGFEKLASELAGTRKKEQEVYDAQIKEVGTENVTLLEDYVKKHYPQPIQQTVLKQLIQDKEARSAALEHRKSLLNSRAPGMSEGNAGADNKPKEGFDGQSELLELAEKQARRPHDMKLRDKLINKAREVGEARYKKG